MDHDPQDSPLRRYLTERVAANQGADLDEVVRRAKAVTVRQPQPNQRWRLAALTAMAAAAVALVVVGAVALRGGDDQSSGVTLATTPDLPIDGLDSSTTTESAGSVALPIVTTSTVSDSSTSTSATTAPVALPSTTSSSSPTTMPANSVSVPATAFPQQLVPCDTDPGWEERHDIDGDGVVETVQILYSPNSTGGDDSTVAICGSALVVEPTFFEAPNKPRVFVFSDIEGDGSVEMFTGGTNCCALFLEVRRLTGNSFGPADLGFTVHEPGYPEFGDPGLSLGCVDVDGDGLREPVELSYAYEGDNIDVGRALETATAMHWTRTVLLPGGGEGQVDTGVFELPAQVDQARIVTQMTCGDVVFFS